MCRRRIATPLPRNSGLELRAERSSITRHPVAAPERGMIRGQQISRLSSSLGDATDTR
jgi:hypothetical protein